MHNCTNFVDENHDSFLEDFGGISEVPDVAEAEDGDDLLSGQHGVDLSSAGHVLRDDFAARLSEAQREQGADLDDGLLQNDGLHGPLLLLLLVLLALVLLLLLLLHLLHGERLVLLLLRSQQRVLRNPSHLLDHLLDRRYHQVVALTREQQRAAGQHTTHETSVPDAQT